MRVGRTTYAVYLALFVPKSGIYLPLPCMPMSVIAVYSFNYRGAVVSAVVSVAMACVFLIKLNLPNVRNLSG